jgi:nucleoside-diphosphate-sugar epimerase
MAEKRNRGSKLDRDGVVLVAGAGGFIGGALVQRLFDDGFRHLRAVDKKPLEEWHRIHPAAECLRLDLADLNGCLAATRGVRYVYNLAADMGGIGFLESNKAACMLSVLINTHLLLAAKTHAIERFFFASSACVYNVSKQATADAPALKEQDAYPADAEDGYGWEKLFSERMCRHFTEDFGLETRVARLHNVYGPHGAYRGGREKAPAAICRKVSEAKLSGRHEIEIWGDGEQSRSFLYIEDCILGMTRIMESECRRPLNLGSSELVTINRLVDLVEEIAGIRLKRTYCLDAPTGVRGRNSDNDMLARTLGWVPEVKLAAGLERTYAWIFDDISRQGARSRQMIKGN